MIHFFGMRVCMRDSFSGGEAVLSGVDILKNQKSGHARVMHTLCMYTYNMSHIYIQIHRWGERPMLFVYLYIYISMCIYVCIRIYMCIYIYIYIYVHVYVYI